MIYYFFAIECRSGCGGRNEQTFATNAAATIGHTLQPMPTRDNYANWEKLRIALGLPEGQVTSHDPVIANENMTRVSNCLNWSPNQFLSFMS